jgi:hypothetical protein
MDTLGEGEKGRPCPILPSAQGAFIYSANSHTPKGHTRGPAALLKGSSSSPFPMEGPGEATPPQPREWVELS